MKKPNIKTILTFKINTKREIRKKKRSTNHKRAISKPSGLLLLAPSYLDLYKPKYYCQTVEFIELIRRSISKRRVTISFRDTKRITAAAGLLLLAEIDRLITAYGRSTIKCIRPATQRDKFGRLDNKVEASLSQIGFFRLLGMTERSFPKDFSVDCWMVDSGVAADGSIAGGLLKKITDVVSGLPTKLLYRGCIEAISNCVEHAYTGQRMDGTNIHDNRWWMFIAIIESRLVVLVCDLGVGIPNTVPKTQEKSILDKLFSMFNFVATEDSGWIKTATLVRETRTELSYRGKGGGDLRSLLQYNDSASLQIFSNKGCYSCHSRKVRSGNSKPIERLYDNKRSILGTIIQWSIDLDK